MPQTLPQLEQRRQQLYRKLEEVGDFRPGMISVRYRKCGKANCLCAHKQHPGHGPQYLWNTTQGGKSRAENLHLGPELEKARQEVENYQRFTGLCRQLVEVNEQICQLRPVPEVADAEALEQLKKNCSGAMRRDRAGSKRAGDAAVAGRGAGPGGHRDGPAGRDASSGELDFREAVGTGPPPASLHEHQYPRRQLPPQRKRKANKTSFLKPTEQGVKS